MVIPLISETFSVPTITVSSNCTSDVEMITFTFPTCPSNPISSCEPPASISLFRKIALAVTGKSENKAKVSSSVSGFVVTSTSKAKEPPTLSDFTKTIFSPLFNVAISV